MDACSQVVRLCMDHASVFDDSLGLGHDALFEPIVRSPASTQTDERRRFFFENSFVFVALRSAHANLP
jgi:hypothetical protein